MLIRLVPEKVSVTFQILLVFPRVGVIAIMDHFDDSTSDHVIQQFINLIVICTDLEEFDDLLCNWIAIKYLTLSPHYWPYKTD